MSRSSARMTGNILYKENSMSILQGSYGRKDQYSDLRVPNTAGMIRFLLSVEQPIPLWLFEKWNEEVKSETS